MTEEWRPAPDYEGLYEVSSLGRVRSLYFGEPRPSRLGADTDGYPMVMLTKDGKRSPKKVHRLVCVAFHGPSRPVHREVAHLDGDKTNARADNLKWCSKVENHSHKRRHGTHQEGERHPNARLSESAVREIRQSTGLRTPMAERYGISIHTVTDIRNGRRWAKLA